MFDSPQIVTLEAVEGDPARLVPSEVNQFVDFVFMLHNHAAADGPSKPIFWWRTASDDVRSYWN